MLWPTVRMYMDSTICEKNLLNCSCVRWCAATCLTCGCGSNRCCLGHWGNTHKSDNWIETRQQLAVSIVEIIRQKKRGKILMRKSIFFQDKLWQTSRYNLSCDHCFLCDTLVKIYGNSGRDLESRHFVQKSPLLCELPQWLERLLVKERNVHVVSVTEMVSLSDSSLKTAVNRTSYSVDGFRPVRTYLLLLPLKTTYIRETQFRFLCLVKI